MLNPNSLSIVVPTLNEAENVKVTMVDLIDALYTKGIDWEIILVNDGSSDGTADVANRLADGESRIKVIHHQRPMGIGCCFKDGVEISTKNVITWFPADGENDPNELVKYLPLLEHVDMVIPFMLNVGMRGWGRRILSTLYLWIINLSFGTMFNYTNGNVLYRRTVFQVVRPKSNGFFYQTECLIKAVRSGFIFAEVPVYLRRRSAGRSKATSLKSFWSVFTDFLSLFIEIHILRKARKPLAERINLS